VVLPSRRTARPSRGSQTTIVSAFIGSRRLLAFSSRVPRRFISNVHGVADQFRNLDACTIAMAGI